jgi:hypothetical protein
MSLNVEYEKIIAIPPAFMLSISMRIILDAFNSLILQNNMVKMSSVEGA